MYSNYSTELMDPAEVNQVLADIGRAVQEMSQAITEACRKMQLTISNASERLNQNPVGRRFQADQGPYGLQALRPQPVQPAQRQQIQGPNVSQNQPVLRNFSVRH